MNKNEKKKYIDNNDIANFNILTSYSVDYDTYEKKNIKNIFTELFIIKKMFCKNNLIEILKLFRHKNKTDFKIYINIFYTIFKMMTEEYINNYEYLLIIFELLKLYKNRKYIMNIIKNIDIDLNNFYISLKTYLLELSLKSELLKILLLLGKQNILLNDLKILFNTLSVELLNYMTFYNIYDKIFDCIDINDYNKDFINENKIISNSYYDEINKNLNDLYDFSDLNKYKVDSEIINYFSKIMTSVTKIKNIE
jgi:hypothetical protein